jgi:Protein of unknown function (DUF3365)
MFTRFKRFSIATQAWFILSLMFLGATSALYFWATDNAVDAELSHTRTVADMADAYRAQAARHSGFYVRREATEDLNKVGKYLASFQSESVSLSGDVKQYVFHQKNPFLALGDFSVEVQKSPAAAKFKMVSDNPFNPENTPDEFEKNALKSVRDQDKGEHWELIGGQLRYARALRAAPACITCHGSPDQAPEAVRAQYRPPIGAETGGGYGYKVGEIVGLTSVSIAHKTPWQMLTSQKTGFWLSSAFVLTLMFISYFLVLGGLVKPLRRLSRYARDIAESEDLSRVRAPRMFDTHESSSKNEIHRQSHALRALYESMLSAAQYIKRMD